MGWMWGLLAVLVVLVVVVGLLVARRRRGAAPGAPSGGDADTVTGGAQAAPHGDAGASHTEPGVAGTAVPEGSGPATPAQGRGPAPDAARAEDAPGAWDDGDRPARPAAPSASSAAAAPGEAPRAAAAPSETVTGSGGAAADAGPGDTAPADTAPADTAAGDAARGGGPAGHGVSAAEPAAVGTRAPGAGAAGTGTAGTGTADDPSRGTGGAAPAGAVPEQARPADRPAAGAGASHVEDDPEPGPTGRHALRDDVEPQALPGVGPAEQAGPPEPMPVPPRSGGATTVPGGAAAAAGGTAAAGGSALAALDSGLISPAATSDPVPQDTRPGPFPGSILAPEDGSDPPETHRVKAHSGSRRFHTPESPYYVRTRADLYFTGDSAARAAGFTAWNERPGAG